jgi:hypothetical protein
LIFFPPISCALFSFFTWRPPSTLYTSIPTALPGLLNLYISCSLSEWGPQPFSTLSKQYFLKVCLIILVPCGNLPSN